MLIMNENNGFDENMIYPFTNEYRIYNLNETY